MVITTTAASGTGDLKPAVECTVASNRQEREAAFRLVYESYLRAGLIFPNRYGMRVTPYHLSGSTHVFVAKAFGNVTDGSVVSTLSLVEDSDLLGLPMQSIFAREVEQRRESGLRVGEVTCFADRRRSVKRFLPTFCQLGRLMSQYARHAGLNQLLVTVHPRHTPFYSRYLGFEPFGQAKPHPHVRSHLAVAMCLDFARIDREPPECYTQFFGVQIPPDQLVSVPMSLEERAYFEPMVSSGDVCHCSAAPTEADTPV